MKKSNKKTARFYLTLISIKILIAIMRLMGKNGTHVPGRKALNLCPDFLDQIDKPEFIIGVTGTNGKTTVSNLIADALEANGYQFVENRFGGNIDTGIVSALIKNATLTGKMKRQYAVLEIDERMTTKIFPYVKPNLLVCTNLFRDSYRRNAHSEFIAGILNQTIPVETKLILNAEDLSSNHLAESNDRVYFGIGFHNEQMTSSDNIIQDMSVCPRCGTKLVYEYKRYNHIGKAHCPHCGFGSPEMDYAVTAIDEKNRRLYLKTPKGEYDVKLLGDNITDAYNTVTAVAALEEFGLSTEQITVSFEKMSIAASRFDCQEVNGHKIITSVAKGQNPIACSRICDWIKHEPGKKTVILLIDDFFDRHESSENMAWIFDTDFEFLNDENITQIIAAGQRQPDNHLRLLMAGVPEEKIICCDDDIQSAELVDYEQVDSIYIMHDIYTTHFAQAVSKRLAERIKEEGARE